MPTQPIRAMPKTWMPVARAIGQGFIRREMDGDLHYFDWTTGSDRCTAKAIRIVSSGYATIDQHGHVRLTAKGTAAMLLSGIGELSPTMQRAIMAVNNGEVANLNGFGFGPDYHRFAERTTMDALLRMRLVYHNGVRVALSGSGDAAMRAINLT